MANGGKKEPVTDTLTIDSLGRLGDGVGRVAGETVHVPFTLPGELVEAGGKGSRRRLEGILEPSPDRIDPVCHYFGTCGGCQLQHVAHSAYLAWKRGLLVEALGREELGIDPEPVVSFAAEGKFGLRRRAVFTCVRAGGKVLFGFSQRQANRIVSVEECPVLVPAIVEGIAELRNVASLFLPRKGSVRVAVIACENGLDIAIEGPVANDKSVQQAISTAIEMDAARLSHNGETLIETRRPLLMTGLAPVTPPPGGFLQAVRQAEEKMAELAIAHLAGCTKAADLFAGHGGFALRLAQTMHVHAIESDSAALAALDRAWRETGGRLMPVTHERRDLYRAPITMKELEQFDGVVFDPPRAGAEAQSHELAKSGVRRIVAISCNPVTLARDLRILVDGGYRITSVTPIDQFVFSHHLEAVALLER